MALPIQTVIIRPQEDCTVTLEFEHNFCRNARTITKVLRKVEGCAAKSVQVITARTIKMRMHPCSERCSHSIREFEQRALTALQTIPLAVGNIRLEAGVN